MSMPVPVLARDSLNFFRNQLLSVLIISLLTAAVTVGLNVLLTYNSNGLALIRALETTYVTEGSGGFQRAVAALTSDDHWQMLKTGLGTIFSSLLGNAVFVTAMIFLIFSVSQGQPVSALQAITGSAGRVPRMLILLLICSLVIALGLVAMYLPGLILAMLLALAPVIMFTEKNSVFTAIKISGNIALKNIRTLLPAILIWFALKQASVVFLSKLPIVNEHILMTVILFINNIISGLVIIYLFRFYQLFTQSQSVSDYQ